MQPANKSMSKLQAATVSNQVVPCKRKRKASAVTEDSHVEKQAVPSQGADVSISAEPESVTVPTKTQDDGNKVRRVRGAAKKPPVLRHNSSSNIPVETEIPWPQHFKQLGQLHRSLNLVYTFCCTRKHLATTFDNIKSAVEGHIQRELLIDDVAQIKALMPRAVNYAYVDEEMLQVTIMGEEDGIKGRTADHFRSLAEDENGRKKELAGKDGQAKEVLLFEFIDGDLKRQVADPKTGKPVNAFQRLRREDLKMPVFSQKQLLKKIEKRNAKFDSAVNAFLNASAAEGLDPVLKLESEKSIFFPVPSTSRSSTPGPERNGSLPQSIPKERKSIAEVVKELQEMEWYAHQIVPDGHRVFDPQPAIYGELTFALSQNMVNALYNTRRITQLYSHQAEAINNLHEGHNVIVATSTSSGKSLIYQIPMLHELEKDPESRGMYIFPTKALAQDQRRSMKEMLRFMPGFEDMLVETFDGDTAMKDRHDIREYGRIIFTNPDMLHITILPQESSWRTFLKNLKYVVVDELHTYNGLFGAHVSFIMRRLRRICAAVGNHRVKFISCSATVANPEEHMKTVFGVDDVRLTDFDGSPSGRKEFVCWNTPFKDPGDPSSGRGDTFAETARLFCQLILRGVRTICFVRIRKQAEVLLGAVKAELHGLHRPECTALVTSYRGGYSAQDRRKIEAEMFGGKLMGIIATTALELGVDIGSLDAVISMGFPYTIANLRQQSGRAGRRNRDSLSVLVGDCFATDQHYMQNPDEIFTKPNCELQVDLTNELVLEGHVQCAAYEMPIRPDEDGKYFGKSLPEVAASRLQQDDGADPYYHCHARFRPQPSKCVSIRDTEDGHFAVVDITQGRNTVLEEVEPSRAFFTIYEGGIFLHQGRTYLVKDFNTDQRIAKVTSVKVDWTTQQREYTDIDPIETEAIRRLSGDSLCRAFFGRIKIHAVIFGFFKLDQKRRILDAVAVDNPPIVILSKGMWLDIPRSALEILTSRRLNLAAGIHAAEHAVLSLMPQFVVSMPGDVRTECKVAVKEFSKKETQRKRPARLTFYDAKGGSGGCGIAAKAFEFVDVLLHRAVDRVLACHCLSGCTECVCDDRCKHANRVMSKAGAEVILKSLLGMYIDVDALPWGPDDEGELEQGIETVIAATEVKGKEGKRVVEMPSSSRTAVSGDGVKQEDEEEAAAAAAAAGKPGGVMTQDRDNAFIKQEEEEEEEL